MQSVSETENESLIEQRFSQLNPLSLNEIRAARRPAVSTLKIKVSVVPQNSLRNLTYQRRNAMINPPRGLLPSVNLMPNFCDN